MNYQRNLYYMLDEDKNIISSNDIETWGNWMETPGNKIIQQDTIKNFFVSTVFLGVDHNFTMEGAPILFETMVFPCLAKYTDVYCRRYMTYQKALKGHKLVCKLAERGKFDDKEAQAIELNEATRKAMKEFGLPLLGEE